MGATQMNTYETTFNSICPVNDVAIDYELKIETPDMLMVEQILEKIESFELEPQYHEIIADKLKELGGKQTLVAYHHGVKITTIR